MRAGTLFALAIVLLPPVVLLADLALTSGGDSSDRHGAGISSRASIPRHEPTR